MKLHDETSGPVKDADSLLTGLATKCTNGTLYVFELDRSRSRVDDAVGYGNSS